MEISYEKHGVEGIENCLTYLAACEPDYIDSDEFEIIGEDEEGREGSADISIINLAEEACKALAAQRKRIAELEERDGEGLPPAKILQEVLLYCPESGLITRKVSGAPCAYAVKKKRKTYLKVRVSGKSYYAHRVAWAIFNGEWPEGEIDHINGDSEDNCIDNLRVVSRKDNCRNVRLQADSKSGFCGVNWHALSQKWRARVKVDGKEYYVGLFNDPEEAAAAIKEKRKELGFHDNHGKPHITDRERWIEATEDYLDENAQAFLTEVQLSSIANAIYDALNSGALTMPGASHETP